MKIRRKEEVPVEGTLTVGGRGIRHEQEYPVSFLLRSLSQEEGHQGKGRLPSAWTEVSP